MKLMILDGNSIVNRAFYGIRPLTTKDGLYTNAIYGFLNILQRVRGEESPDALCVAFDLKGPTFRHLRYEGYKATRKGMPEELAQQMPVLKEVLSAMNIPQYACKGWEADDVLGTVGRLCEADGWDCVIVTGDRDSLQLVTEHVTVKLITSRTGQTLTTNYTPAVFEEEYGFGPRGIIDLKSLMGDSSDNIPGVPGVGEKTAKALLADFGTMQAVYDNLDSPKIREAVRKKLAAGRDSAMLSYELATILPEAPIEFQPEHNLVQPVDNNALYALFLKLEFSRLIERYGLHKPKMTASAASQETAPAQMQLPAAEAPAAILLSGARFAVAADGAVYAGAIADHRDWLETFLQSDAEKVFCDYKTQLHLLHAAELPEPKQVFDTAVAAYVLNAAMGDYSLKKLALAYLAEELPDDLCAQASAIWALRPILAPKLSEQGVEAVYREIDLPLCPVLVSMEETGVLVDRDALEQWGEMLASKTRETQAEIYELAGMEFNINSTKQLGEVLFERLELPHGKKTSRGYSTNVDVLEKLAAAFPIARAVLDYRTYTKMKSTYAEGLLKVIAPDGRIHTTFQNLVTATGRLSSTDPNLQNIPVRTELGSEIRKMFVPAPGCVFVDADYSQIELRVLAHIADDPLMQQAFCSGEDIHRATASQVFGVAPEEVTPEMRRGAKAVNFGIVYGISEFSLAEDLGVSRQEAKAYIDGYLARYAGVRQYMRDVVADAKRDGYVTTMFGRRRDLPELHSSNFNIRSANERIAMNTPIQGTAADIIKLAMIAVDRAIRTAGLRAQLVLQVHDELIVECPAEEQAAVMALLEEKMEQVAQLKVPLLAEAKAGESWYAAK